ncbi:MAG: hypothetical protein ACRCT8_08535 [Lacipirellulaceae bacterium]
MATHGKGVSRTTRPSGPSTGPSGSVPKPHISLSAARPAKGSRRSAIGDRYRLEGTYERLRRALLEAPNDGRLDRALSYWVLPTDRRLPIAFLDRDLRDLLSLPLGDLMGTQGVGQKKILGFFDLLRRAVKAQAPHAPFGLGTSTEATAPQPAARTGVMPAFDPAGVSEAVWASWCETVTRTGLAKQKLGRVAPSLRSLPTVIWHKTLGEYSSMPLATIRDLKTHGEKRVNAILEVFHFAHEALSTAVLAEELELDVRARFVPTIERWLVEANRAPHRVTLSELHERVVRPLVEQVARDLGATVAQLVEERLRIDGAPPSVKQQADRLGVTRARIYQLLEECGKAMEVRWPEGRWLLAPLAQRPAETDPAMLGLLHGLRAIFYPTESAG